MAEPQFTGQTALVTGAASGIGLAVAQALAAQGAQVVVSDRDQAQLEAAASTIPRATPVVADLSSRQGALDLVAAAGEVDILVNNAGLQQVAPVEEFEPERWDTLLAVMLTAPFLLIRGLLPAMYERGHGRIVNVSSVHGLTASPYKSAYVSAKHGSSASPRPWPSRRQREAATSPATRSAPRTCAPPWWSSRSPTRHAATASTRAGCSTRCCSPATRSAA